MQHGKFKRALGFFPITDIQLKVAYEVYKLSNVFILTLYIHYIIIIIMIIQLGFTQSVQITNESTEF